MVETINTMVGGVTIADGQTRSLQLTESDDDSWTSKQTGGMPAWLPALITSFHFFYFVPIYAPFSLLRKLWRWHPSLAFWRLLNSLSWCCFFVAALEYSNTARLVTCHGVMV